MTNQDALEQAYKNGYEQGKKDAVVHAYWTFKGTSIDNHKMYECSACKNVICGSDNYCKNCGALMEDKQ